LRELEPLTQRQIDVIKDVSIAFLSTSALLLTLILGFVAPSIPQVGVERFAVAFTALCLILTAISAAGALVQLADAVVDKPVAVKNFRVLHYMQIMFFFLALFSLLVAILVVVPPV
jgi:hypothetical protein